MTLESSLTSLRLFPKQLSEDNNEQYRVVAGIIIYLLTQEMQNNIISAWVRAMKEKSRVMIQRITWGYSLAWAKIIREGMRDI